MDNLFGAEYSDNNCAAECAAETPKKGKGKANKGTTTPAKPKMNDDTELGMREISVKVYNDYYTYIAPPELETPTLGDVRKFLVAQGYNELSVDRTQFMWANEDAENAEEKFLVAGVKFEKQG